MGACLSVGPPARAATLADIERTLSTGDVVMLLDGSKGSKYLFKAGPAGGWARAAKVGFLVRRGPGPAGLTLYHADSPSEVPGTVAITSASFQSELASGQHRAVVIRCLHKRLDAQQIELVNEFAALNVGKIVPVDQHPASILMANLNRATTTAYERLSCSEFVAMMLHLVGLVAPTGIRSEYAATHRKGRVVGPTLAIRLLHRTSSSVGRTSPQSVLNTMDGDHTSSGIGVTTSRSSTGESTPHAASVAQGGFQSSTEEHGMPLPATLVSVLAS